MNANTSVALSELELEQMPVLLDALRRRAEVLHPRQRQEILNLRQLEGWVPDDEYLKMVFDAYAKFILGVSDDPGVNRPLYTNPGKPENRGRHRR